MVLKNASESGYYVTQRQWTPTKPRAPIAADFQTPGPGSFNIPATIGKNANQVVKGKSPAYTFGAKIDDKRPDFVPGPGTYNISGLSERGKDTCQAPTIAPKIEDKVDNFVPGPGSYNIAGLSEKGKDVCNAPTIAAKLKEPESFKTPAPGAYNPEKTEITQTAAPRYTFGAKLKDQTPDDIPGNESSVSSDAMAPTCMNPKKECRHSPKNSPNLNDPILRQQSLNRQNPSYSFATSRSPQRQVVFDSGPAPGYYCPERSDSARFARSPSFTIRGRTYSPREEEYPSPADYVPERADNIRYSSPPRYTFGSRGRYHEEETYPSPNDYHIEKSDDIRYRSPPRWSFRSRSRTPHPSESNPSPNCYTVDTADRQRFHSPPKYTIAGRTKIVNNKENYPGPGHYDPTLYGTIRKAENLSTKLEPKHLRYLKRSEDTQPKKFKFIDDPYEEPVRKKKTEEKKSWFPSFASSQKKDKAKTNTNNKKSNERNPKSNSSEHNALAKQEKGRSSWTQVLRLPHKKSKEVSDTPIQSSTAPQANQSSIGALPSTPTIRGSPGQIRNSSLNISNRRSNRYTINGERDYIDTEFRDRSTEVRGGYGKDPREQERTPTIVRKRTSRPTERSEKARSEILTRSHSFGTSIKNKDTVTTPTIVKRSLPPTPSPQARRRHHSAESIRLKMPSRFESYSSPTQSFCQKILSTDTFNRWPSLKRMKDSTPAPGDYHPERADNLVRPLSPAYTFGLKTPQLRQKSFNPAPCDYLPDKANKMIYKSSPKYTFRSKTADPEVIFNERFFNSFPYESTPGRYSPEKSALNDTAPKYTFGLKIDYDKPNGVPAPGRYNPPAPEAYKKKSPAYTLSYRTNIPTDNTKKPGPGQYTPERVFMNKQSAPRFSFGIRHSPCAETK